MKSRTALILAAFAIALGIGLYVGFDKSRTAAPISGTAPAASPAPVAPRLAATLPDFKLADRAGELKSLRDFGEKALIVNFWATWCAPCRREIPLLEKLQAEHGPEGFQVVGIAVDFRDAVLAYAEEMQIGYPLLIGEQEALDAATAFGVDTLGLPFTVFTDRQGRVIAAHIGELHADQAAVFLGAIRRVHAGELTPESARREIGAALAMLPERAAPTG